MTALYDTIQALRAELRSFGLTYCERARIEAELAKAIEKQAEMDRELDALLAEFD